MDKTKITSHQLFSMSVIFTCGFSIITNTTELAEIAKQDIWISSIIATVAGFLFIWLYANLGILNPGETLVDIINLSLGKWVGGFVSAAFVFMCLLNASQVISYIGGFMITQCMPETPVYIINAVVAVSLIIALLYGLETIGRSSEIFFYIVFVLILLNIILNIPNAKIENLQPVLEKGINPILKGSLFLSSHMVWPIIVLNMVFPVSVIDTKKAKKSLYLGYLCGAMIIFICNLMSILVLGSTITARTQYPIYLLAKLIDIANITRIEFIVSTAWIITMFIKTVLYFYAGVLGLSQLLGLKDYRKIVLPLVLILFVFSGVVFPNSAYQIKWDTITFIPYMASFGVILPLILFIVSLVKPVKNK